MNAQKTFAAVAVLVLTSFSSASAAVGNVNSRGQYFPMGTNGVSAARSYAPAYSAQAYRAPMVTATPAPQVATAPTDARRFSYAPSPVVSNACQPGTASATAASNARRFSYAPDAASAVTASPTTRNVYLPSIRYSRGASRPTVEAWQLPKTDPRKYNPR
jgi:hypothetical protein